MALTISRLKDELQQWNWTIFWNILRRKRRCLAGIQGIQDINGSPYLEKLEEKFRKEHNSILQQEEIDWFQKARVNWLQFGERNTKYFHTTTIIRKRKSRILSLKRCNGMWSFDPVELTEMAISYFSDLYFIQKRLIQIGHTLMSKDFQDLSEQELRWLNHPISDEEIKKAVYSMRNLIRRQDLTAFNQSSIRNSGTCLVHLS